jgi:hypothetical protein
MKYWIPVYLTIDVPSPAHALAAKQTVEHLLSNGMVGVMLTSNGVLHERITVADPAPIPASYAASGERRG